MPTASSRHRHARRRALARASNASNCLREHHRTVSLWFQLTTNNQQLTTRIKKYRATYCARNDPLPLLPSGPGGVGGITSRRTRHCSILPSSQPCLPRHAITATRTAFANGSHADRGVFMLRNLAVPLLFACLP